MSIGTTPQELAKRANEAKAGVPARRRRLEWILFALCCVNIAELAVLLAGRGLGEAHAD
jgi:hypothetical protein